MVCIHSYNKTPSMMLLLFITLSIFGVTQTHGQCEFSPLKTEISAFGTRRSYCEHLVKDGMSVAKLRVLPETTFKTLDCHTCTCNQYGMRCCPSNRDPRSLQIPRHCRIVMDGCTPTPVRKSDNKTDCYTAKPVQVVRQNRQRINNVLTTLDRVQRMQRQQVARGGETPEGPTPDQVIMMMALSGALENPYNPLGTSGGMYGPPFENSMMPFLMLGMMGS
ncbi:uncharacterized protein LOC134707985 [Mytilus trossulus]|uniref:uncharacterized protein LOC134707985 n=1 Tax=Mytilus trossulus TaxID=6551 RepID=UPI003005F36A